MSKWGRPLRPAIRTFGCFDPECGGNPWAYQPLQADDVDVEVTMAIDETGSGSHTETYSVAVVTPEALTRRIAANGPLFGHGTLVMTEWDVQLVTDLLRQFVESIEEPTVDDVRAKLRRRLHFGA